MSLFKMKLEVFSRSFIFLFCIFLKSRKILLFGTLEVIMSKIYPVLSAILVMISTYAIAIDINSQAVPQISCQFVSDSCLTNQSPARLYRMQIPSPVRDTPAILFTRQLDNNVNGHPVYLSKNGSIRSPDASKDAIMAFSGGYGESFDLLLFEVDKKGNPLIDKLIARGFIIPFPLKFLDTQGHTVEIHPLDGNGEFFMINYSGFFPNEQIQFTSRSSGESMTDIITANENGFGCMGYAPAVVGRNEGPFEICFKTKNMPQSLTIKHYWGKIAFRTLNKYHELQQKYP